MTRQKITTTGAPVPLSRFSQGVRAGSIVQTSGQGPLDPATGEVIHLGDVAAQTRQTLKLVKAILNEGGASVADVIMFRVFLTDRANFAAMNAVYEEFISEEIGDGAFPARTTLMVGLPLEGMLVEIDALAVLES
jgi:2-iminobutanoate/2-iminopropanoate deaminase